MVAYDRIYTTNKQKMIRGQVNMTTMGTTLYEFFKYCEKAIHIYGEDSEKVDKLRETIRKLKNEWLVTRNVRINAVVKWLDEDISLEDKKTLIEALKTVELDIFNKQLENKKELDYIKNFV